MNYLFCGGRFHFDYLKEGYLSQELRSPCWYPMLMAEILGDLEYEAVSCRDMGDAREKILRKVEKLSGGEV